MVTVVVVWSNFGILFISRRQVFDFAVKKQNFDLFYYSLLAIVGISSHIQTCKRLPIIKVQYEKKQTNKHITYKKIKKHITCMFEFTKLRLFYFIQN